MRKLFNPNAPVHEVRFGLTGLGVANTCDRPAVTGLPDRYFTEVARGNGQQRIWEDIWPARHLPHIDEGARTVLNFRSHPGALESEHQAMVVAASQMAGWLIKHELLDDPETKLFVAETRVGIPKVGTTDFVAHTDEADRLLQAAVADFQQLSS